MTDRGLKPEDVREFDLLNYIHLLRELRLRAERRVARGEDCGCYSKDFCSMCPFQCPRDRAVQEEK